MTELFAFVVLVVGTVSAPPNDPNPPDTVAAESPATTAQPTDGLDAVVLIARTSGRSVVRGSGVTIAEDQSAWYVLANAHVAGRAGEQVQCVFFKQGYASRSVPGQVVWASYKGTATAGGDAAMVTVPKAALGNIRLAVRAMQYSSRAGENVLDLFGGSGSTLIAAEQTGRKAFLMELDAAYCDVIVQRFEQFAGKKAERCCPNLPINGDRAITPDVGSCAQEPQP